MMMNKKNEYLRGVLLLAGSLSASALGAQTLLEWDFGGRGTGSPATQAANVVSADVESSTLSLGSGLSIANGSNSFYAIDFPATGTGLSDAIAGDDYFTFTVEAVDGLLLNLTELDFTLRRASSATAQKFQWQYSLDGFLSSGVNLGSEVDLSGSTAVVGFDIDLGAVSELQSVSSVEFRLYGYDRASSSNGSGGFSGNDAIVLSGTSAVIPESSYYAGLISMMIFTGTVVVRRRRS